MTLSNKSIKYHLPIVALSLVLNACSSIPQEKVDMIKPDSLSIKESIVAKSAEERNQFVENKLEIEKAKIEQKKPTEKVDNIAGFGVLETNDKTPPIFENTEQVTISVDGMTVVEFIHYVFDELLNLNYVISTQLQSDTNKVSLNLSDPVDKDVLYSTSEQLLAENDIALLRKDNIIYFQKKAKNKRYKTASVGIGRLDGDVPDTTGEIVQIIPYVYTNSSSLSSVITKLTGVKVQIDGKRKIVMAEGAQKEIHEVMRVLRMLDVPSSSGKEIRLIDLAYISPDDLVKQLAELLQNDGFEVGNDKDITFVTMPRLGAIVVYAVSLDAVERVELWSQKLDVAVAGNEPQFFVYRPLFNKANDLQTSLSPIINSILNDAQSSENSVIKADAKSNSGASSSRSTSSMTVDETQNALVFYTTSERYRKVLQLLQKLDLLPGQVILDIAIAEVTLSDGISSGVDWFYDSKGQTEDGSTNVLPTSLTGSLLSSGALNLVGIDGDWRVALNFLKSKQNIKVLSKPFFIVKDGESATINSGSQVPTITQTSTSDTDRVTNSVQYITTGIQVAITPTINAKGLINLEISMSSSSPTGDSLTPSINSRSIQTNVFSADGQTVALGGLIQETLNDTSKNVPFLSSLPILGKLFGTNGDSYARTELMMLITTRIVTDVNEVDEFRDKILDLYSFPLDNSK
ncbi:secretin N-terminal domain-containing protein [Colwellia sp. RE-S-Sl-9]